MRAKAAPILKTDYAQGCNMKKNGINIQWELQLLQLSKNYSIPW